jgi:hypothetical protein
MIISESRCRIWIIARSQFMTSAYEEQAKGVRNMWKRYEKDVKNFPKKRNLSSKCKRHQIYMEIGELKVINESEDSQTKLN